MGFQKIHGLRLKHQHKICQFLCNHKVKGWEAPKPVGLGQRAITPFVLRVLLRAEIKAGKTFADFCFPESRAGGPKCGGTGTDFLAITPSR